MSDHQKTPFRSLDTFNNQKALTILIEEVEFCTVGLRLSEGTRREYWLDRIDRVVDNLRNYI